MQFSCHYAFNTNRDCYCKPSMKGGHTHNHVKNAMGKHQRSKNVKRICGMHPRFGCATDMKINDETDDVSNWAKYAAKKLTEAKDFHVELPEMLPKFLKENPTSALTEINKHMMERILAFARAGHHQRVYVVIEFTYTDKPGAVTWNQHLFGYGDRGVAFKLAKKLHETVQMYDFGGPL